MSGTLPTSLPADLPTTASAAVMHAFNEPLVVEPLPMPKALADGELLIRVELAGVCGTDVHLHRGELPVPLPLVMGSFAPKSLKTGPWYRRSVFQASKLSWS